jgi:hypothetical protein
MNDPEGFDGLRASDAERDRAAEFLREAMTSGASERRDHRADRPEPPAPLALAGTEDREDLAGTILAVTDRQAVRRGDACGRGERMEIAARHEHIVHESLQLGTRFGRDRELANPNQVPSSTDT